MMKAIPVDLNTLMRMLAGGDMSELEAMFGEAAPTSSPADITQADMDRGNRFLTDLMGCTTLEEFKHVAEWIEHWHTEPGLKDNGHRHSYVHALLEVAPLLAIIRLGPDVEEQLAAVHGR